MKAEEEFAKSLAPSDKTKAKAKAEHNAAEAAYNEAKDKFAKGSPELMAAERRAFIARSTRDRVLGNKDEIEKRVKTETLPELLWKLELGKERF